MALRQSAYRSDAAGRDARGGEERGAHFSIHVNHELQEEKTVKIAFRQCLLRRLSALVASLAEEVARRERKRERERDGGRIV